MPFLLENVSTNGDGTPVKADAGVKNIYTWATAFGGGTVTIQVSPDNGITWITLTNTGGTDVTFTANGAVVVDFAAAGVLFRASLSGSTGASGVNCLLLP